HPAAATTTGPRGTADEPVAGDQGWVLLSPWEAGADLHVPDRPRRHDLRDAPGAVSGAGAHRVSRRAAGARLPLRGASGGSAHRRADRRMGGAGPAPGADGHLGGGPVGGSDYRIRLVRPAVRVGPV